MFTLYLTPLIKITKSLLKLVFTMLLALLKNMHSTNFSSATSKTNTNKLHKIYSVLAKSKSVFKPINAFIPHFLFFFNLLTFHLKNRALPIAMFFALAISQNVWGQTPLPQESFEVAVPPTNWSRTTTNSSYPVTQYSTNYWGCGYPAGNSAVFDSYWIASNGYSTLSTPAFSLSGYIAANLNFSLINISTGGFYVDVSTDGGTSYTNGTTNYTTISTTAFEVKTFNLSSYLGQTNIKIRFRCISNYGSSRCNNMAYLDLVSVTGTLCTSPTLAATTAASSIGCTTATSGGNVTADGGCAVTERGICYSTVTNPTTANTKITASGTTGSFTSNLTGLSPGQIYYVRSYAINSSGTSYGAEINFTTSPLPGTPTAITPTAVCANTAATFTTSATGSPTSYSWTLPAGWTGSSTSSSITATTNGTGGTISVTATNACGTSAATITGITVTNLTAPTITNITNP